MARPEPRILNVIDSFLVTPNMQRIVLGGSGLKGFPAGQSGGYVKLVLPVSQGARPEIRTYTIRSHSETTLDIDFALHGVGTSQISGDQPGPATRWAANAKAGQSIAIAGPGPSKPLPEGYGPFLMAGDMTALPAISVNLAAMHDEAVGNAIILIQNEADRQDLVKPIGIDIHWIIDPDSGSNPSLLPDAVRKLEVTHNLAYAWVACEFEAMKLIRQYLRYEQKLTPEKLYISSYWKRGLIEDDHKAVKRADAESEG